MMQKTLLMLIATVFVACVIACGGGNGPELSPSAQQSATGDASWQGQEASAADDLIDDYPPRPAIPGLQAVDVQSSLSELGFTESDSARWLGNEYFRTYRRQNETGLDDYVEIWSPDETSVSEVEAMVTAPRDRITEAAGNLFLRLAELRYTGANPSRAKAWISQNMGSNATVSISGVPFELFANVDTARMLSIGITSPENAPESLPGEADGADMSVEEEPSVDARETEAVDELAMLLAEDADLSKKGGIDEFSKRLGEFADKHDFTDSADKARREAAALGALRVAYVFGETGKSIKYRLEELIEKYPGTLAAKEAAKLLPTTK